MNCESVYCDAYCRLDVKPNITDNISISASVIENSKNIYKLFEDAIGNFSEHGEKRIIFDGIAAENKYNRQLLIERILDFLVNNEDAYVTYIAEEKDVVTIDKFAMVMAQSMDMYYEGISDICEDDYIVLIAKPFWNEELWSNDLSYIKVYPDGKCKLAFYSKYDYSENHAQIISLEKSFFDRIMTYVTNKVMSRKANNLLCGESEVIEDEPFYSYGYKAFGQDSLDYESDTHYFKRRTFIKVLDELIEMARPILKRPSLAGMPTPSSAGIFADKMRALTEYEDLLGDPRPEYYEEEPEVTEFLNSLFRKSPITNGKEKCERLREIRMKFAKDNNIPYEFKECTHEGPCAGTCPLCDKEATDLAELAKEHGIVYDSEG